MSRGPWPGSTCAAPAPGTRETDALRPSNAVTEAQAVLLTGGSAFGLDAASGVVRYLEERGYGFSAGGYRVPIVPAAVLFDLSVGDGNVRPAAHSGYAACVNASAGLVPEGSVGAGTGATVGKLLGPGMAVKGGLGVSCVEIDDGVVVGAVVAVNAVGSIVDPATAELVAGPRTSAGMVDAAEALVGGAWSVAGLQGRNTTIGVVATNARLNKEQVSKLASVSHDGIALSVRPAHTMSDGDTMFALATGHTDAVVDMHALCAAATLCTAQAIVRGVRDGYGAGRHTSGDGDQGLTGRSAMRRTIRGIKAMKRKGQKIAMVTAYDATSAAIVERAGIPVVLVGDSVGNVMLGHGDTLPVTMDDMVHHVKAVVRGTEKAHVVADLPFMSYQASVEDAVRNSGRMVLEGGCPVRSNWRAANGWQARSSGSSGRAYRSWATSASPPSR